MEGWTWAVPPSTHLPSELLQPEAPLFHNSTSTFFHPVESQPSPEDQLRRWAQLEQLQSVQQENHQEQVIHEHFYLQPQIHPELISQEPTAVSPDPICQELDIEASRLPQDPDMGRRKQTTVAPVANMASALPGAHSTINTTKKDIPLLCIVCPQTPSFSDVSHLLTHIASKGHLHHETQTKLKAHQDISAGVALQQYDLWYKQYGIESLLVQRLKAKQVKEAAKNKRSRTTPANAPVKPKKKLKRSANNTPIIKVACDQVSPDDSVYPDLFNSDKDGSVVQEYLTGADALALKGQVWPGMGKMDLANEEMRRTRNQRKPKSVIEKMQRISEGIEPTQVVMTPELVVERIKDVYDDSSSPIIGQEESTPPRKVPKPRRRKQEPLAELSTNVPRQRRTSTRSGTRTTKGSDTKLYAQDAPQGLIQNLGSFRNAHDVFQDDGASTASYDSSNVPFVSQNDRSFELRDRYESATANPISHSEMVSPTPGSRAIPLGFIGESNNDYGRTQIHTYTDPFCPQGSAYGLNDTALYNSHMNLSFGASTHYDSNGQIHFRTLPRDHMQSQQNNHSGSTNADRTRRSSGSQYIGLPGTNPLFSHDRGYPNSYGQAALSTNYASQSYNQSNGTNNHANRSLDHSSTSDDDMVKCEAGLNNDGCKNDNKHSENADYSSPDQLWNAHTASAAMSLHDDLDSEHLRL